MPFIVVTSALFPSKWFEDSKRPYIIGMSSLFFTIGVGIGFIIPVLFINDYENNLEDQDLDKLRREVELSLIPQAIFGGVMALITILTFQNKPKHPPSQLACNPRDDDILGCIRTLIVDIQYLKVCIAFTCYFSNFLVLSIIIEPMTFSFGFSSDQSGIFGSMALLGSFLGIMVYGVILKVYKTYKTANVAIGITSIISLVILIFALRSQEYWIVILAYTLVGF